MSMKPPAQPEFPGVDEMKYLNIVAKKQFCAVFTGAIPLIFLRNPKGINLRSLQVGAGCGMVFFRAGAEDEARKLSNLFADFDCYYSRFVASSNTDMKSLKSGQKRPCSPYPYQACTVYTIPTGIEPHDGIEYALMQKALKNVALFDHFIPIEFVINPLRLEMKYLEYKEGSGRIYFRPGHEVSANELKKLLTQPANPLDEKLNRRIGQLLGYQHADIEQFLSYMRDLSDFYRNAPD